ncbi:MAG: hypothetical protein LBV37_00590 [Mycoplasmataceae bacterium]|jgi:hypothetical protein|nr:hypothetical protein [Mycoplasmataceae bacterium]
MDMHQQKSKWYHKLFIKAMCIHKDAKSRQKFTKFYLLFIGIIFLFYCISGVFFYLYGLRFNPDSDPNYIVTVKFGWALYVGLALFILATIVAFIIGIFIIIMYKESRRLYFQTTEYLKKLAFYQSEKLEKYSLKELKWIYKLGYIDRITYRLYCHPQTK